MRCKVCGGKTHIWQKKLFDDRHGYSGYFDVIRCSRCKFGQTFPEVLKREIPHLYKKYYPKTKINWAKIRRSDYKVSNFFTLWRKGLLINCQYLVKPGSRVLDVGSGIGFSLLELESLDCKAYGIDPNPKGALLAKRFGLKFHRGFIDDNPFRRKKFDYVIGSQVIEHTQDPLKFLQLCKKRLTRGGQVILSFPNTNSLTRILLGKDWLHWHVPYHFNHFNKKSIKILAQKAGLKIQGIRTVTPNMWTNLQMRRLLVKTRVGERDPFWDGGRSDSQKIGSFLIGLMMFLEEYNFANRLIDALGLGESFVVVLSTSKETR